MNENVESLGEESLAEVQEQDQEALNEQSVETEVDTSEETETSGEEGTEDKPKKKGGFQRKIDALEREKFERDRQIAELQSRLETITRQQPAEQPVDDMPRLADFGYDEDQYRAALHNWHQNKVTGLQDQQRQQQEQQKAYAEAIRQQQVLQEKMQKGVEKYPDFIQKVNDGNLPPFDRVNPLAFRMILESDVGEDMAYYLANRPQEYYRLGQMANNQVQTVREMTLLEAKLKAAPPKQVKIPPKPPSTVASGSSEAIKDPEKMTTEEWLAWRNGQLQAKTR